MQKFRELILVQLLCIYAQGPYRVRKVTFPNFIYGEFKTKKRAETHKLPYYLLLVIFRVFQPAPWTRESFLLRCGICEKIEISLKCSSADEAFEGKMRTTVHFECKSISYPRVRKTVVFSFCPVSFKNQQSIMISTENLGRQVPLNHSLTEERALLLIHTIYLPNSNQPLFVAERQAFTVPLSRQICCLTHWY